jgi:hypothetical protein
MIVTCNKSTKCSFRDECGGTVPHIICEECNHCPHNPEAKYETWVIADRSQSHLFPC